MNKLYKNRLNDIFSRTNVSSIVLFYTGTKTIGGGHGKFPFPGNSKNNIKNKFPRN
jgi:hypothetical protein